MLLKSPAPAALKYSQILPISRKRRFRDSRMEYQRSLHVSSIVPNQHELQQNNESLIGDAQQKEKTVVHQEAYKARSSFTEQISILQSLRDDEFDRLDPNTLEPIKTTIRREI